MCRTRRATSFCDFEEAWTRSGSHREHPTHLHQTIDRGDFVSECPNFVVSQQPIAMSSRQNAKRSVRSSRIIEMYSQRHHAHKRMGRSMRVNYAFL